MLADIFGVKLALYTDDEDYKDFIIKNYSCFLVDNMDEADITVNFSADAGNSALAVRQKLYRFGEHIFADDRNIYWENEFGFRILLNTGDDGKINIYSFHYDLLKNSDAESRYRNYQRSMRWALHFPVFTLLKVRKGLHLIHASAVSKDGKSLIFCGLNKVGKSTLAMYLCNKYSYKLMTDNFLLITDKRVYGFPEVVRLSTESAEALNNVNKPIYGHKIYEKIHILARPETICLESTPFRFFILTNSNNISLSEIEPERAVGIAGSMGDFLQEFPDYSYMAFTSFLKGELGCRCRHEALNLHKTRFFHLSIPLNWNIENVVKEIEKCI